MLMSAALSPHALPPRTVTCSCPLHYHPTHSHPTPSHAHVRCIITPRTPTPHRYMLMSAALSPHALPPRTVTCSCPLHYHPTHSHPALSHAHVRCIITPRTPAPHRHMLMSAALSPHALPPHTVTCSCPLHYHPTHS